MKNVVFIKLGGSLITDKNKPYIARVEVIQKIVQELKEVIPANPDTQFILGNGAGSFGHYPMVKYNLKEGIKTPDQVFGFCEVQDGVARLNRIVMGELLKQQIAACTLSPSSIYTSSQGKVATSYFESFLGFLNLGIIPVVYGDPIYDNTKGCHVFSTEYIFEILIEELIKRNYVVAKVIHLTVVDGVLDTEGNIISTITPANFEEVKSHLYKTEGFDITGGMLHKIEKSFEYAKKGIETIISNGRKDTIIENILHPNSQISFTRISS